jgi:hypothetical protein
MDNLPHLIQKIQKLLNDAKVPSIGSLRSTLGGELFEELYEEGRAMTLEQAVAYALEEYKECFTCEDHPNPSRTP